MSKTTAPQASRLSDLTDGSSDVLRLDPRTIVIDPGFNYRNFSLKPNKEHLADTKESIRVNGILNPLWVRFDPDDKLPHLVAGETRLRAALELMKESKEAKAMVENVPVIQKAGTPQELLLLSLQENTQKPPSQWEVGLAYKRLMEGETPMTVEEIARVMGQKPKYVRDAIALDEADPEVKTLLSQMAVTPAHALAVIKSHGGKATATLIAQSAEAKKAAAERLAAKEAKKEAGGKKGGRPAKEDKPVTVKREKKAGGKFIRDAVLKMVVSTLKSLMKHKDIDVSMTAEEALDQLQAAMKKE